MEIVGIPILPENDNQTRTGMKNPQDVLLDYLQAKGLKMTPQRRVILDIFLETKGHLTAEEIYDRVKNEEPGIGQATVYRTMKLLAEAGLAKEVDFSEGVTRYEPDYGHEHHDHLICENCRKTIEICDDDIERLQVEVAGRHGFKLTGHKMYLFGVCQDCRKKS